MDCVKLQRIGLQKVGIQSVGLFQIGSKCRKSGGGGSVVPSVKPIAAWSAAGKTNEDEDRAVLKDLTGNGHDITLNGFAFSEMSGYGGYKIKDNHWTIQKIEEGSYINTKTSISYIPSEDGAQAYNIGTFLNEGDVVSVKITGIPKGGIVQFGYGETIWIIADKDGIYKGSYMRNANNTCDIRSTNCIGSRITIEWLPEYPDALVFDGVDDYGVCENMPIQDDFTFIYKAIGITDTKYAKGVGFTKRNNAGSANGAFIIGKSSLDVSNFRVFSYGAGTVIEDTYYKNLINYCTKFKFNSKSIYVGEKEDTNTITIGALQIGNEFANMAFYSAYLFDRSLTEQEIKAFIRKNIDPEYVLPSEQEITE